MTSAPPVGTRSPDAAADPVPADPPGAARPPAEVAVDTGGPVPRAGLRELLAPVRGRLVLAVVLQAVGSLAGVVPFVAVAELGRVLLDPAGSDDSRAWAVAGVGAGALVVRLACLMAASGLTHLADNDLALDLRRRLAAHLGRLPLGWFTERNSGRVRKAVQDDVNAMHHLVGHAFTDLTAAVVVPVASLAYLAWVDWRLALLTLVPVAGGLAAYASAMSGSRDKYATYDASLARLAAGSVEFAQGIAVVKTFGQAGRAHRRFVTAADDFARFFTAWVRGVFRASGTLELLMSPVFMLLWVLAAGTAFAAAGWLPPVDLLAFAVLTSGLTAPWLALGYSAESMRSAGQAAARIGELLATPVLPEPEEPRAPEGSVVEVDDVSYSYDGRTTAVDGVSLTMAPGTVTALVGPSGSGKTTLARLLPRFFDVTAGAVRIGGVDVRDLGSDRLYGLVSFVFQDVQLLRASIRDNIALARPDAGAAEIEAAARAAQIHDRIVALPRGYDSVAGEDARLSGGEAQRVSIARALLADTPILVLDEATAFADPESEAAIQDALSALAAGRTLLVIAHRLSTIVQADQILVMDAGRVVERGRHPDLVATGGAYARAWAAHERASRLVRTSGTDSDSGSDL
jgi:ATP-binding cassette subfamily B protein